MILTLAAFLIAQTCPCPSVSPTPKPTVTPTPTPKPTATPVPTATPNQKAAIIKAAGLLDASKLKPSSGITAKTAGQVIENLDVTGNIKIQANNVTIRNCRITNGVPYGINDSFGFKGAIVQNVEVIGADSAGIYSTSNIQILNSYVHDSANDGFKMEGQGWLIKASYVTKLGKNSTCTKSCPHADGIQSADDKSVGSLIGNVFDMPFGQSGYHANRNLMVTGSEPAWIVDSNFLNGGNWTISCPAGSAITNNIFGSDNQYGISTNCSAKTWTGNKCENGQVATQTLSNGKPERCL